MNYTTNTNNINNAKNDLYESRHGHRTLHDGAITVVRLIHNNEFVMTAGEDGKMKYFRRSELEHAEPDNGSVLASSPSYAPRCLLELTVTPHKPIRSITLKTV